MLSITSEYTLKDIQKEFAAFTEEIKDDYVEALSKTLRQLVDKARAKTKADQGFNNISWNLRASIGGVITRDHQIIYKYFPPIGKGDEGHKTGNDFAAEIAHLDDDGDITIIFVAGMDYGRFVESKGADVITGSALHMEEYLRKNIINN